jgi:hypothetical protein
MGQAGQPAAVGPADGHGIGPDRHDGPAGILIGQEIMAAA